jgi:hypothetical protein
VKLVVALVRDDIASIVCGIDRKYLRSMLGSGSNQRILLHNARVLAAVLRTILPKIDSKFYHGHFGACLPPLTASLLLQNYAYVWLLNFQNQ